MNIYQIVCCVVSIFLNSVLTLLIATKSPKTLGIYRYLMLYISIFEMIYSILDTVVEPIVHHHKGALAVMRYNGNSIFDRNTSFLLVCGYCGFFGLSLSIFGVHFVYRYGTIAIKFHKKYLSGNKMILLFLMPIWYFIWWAGMCFIWFKHTNETDRYIESSVLENHGFKIENTSSMCVLYYPLDQNGVPHPDWKTFGVLCIFCFMIGSSMFCVFYFGFKCYFEIKKSLKMTKTVSHVTKNLQQQLFQALVMQTFIPLVLMYIPIGTVFIFPLINMNFGVDTSFVGYTIATYPAIDPIPNMLIIRSYRNAVLDFFGCSKLHKYDASRTNTNSAENRLPSN